MAWPTTGIVNLGKLVTLATVPPRVWVTDKHTLVPTTGQLHPPDKPTQ